MHKREDIKTLFDNMLDQENDLTNLSFISTQNQR